MPPTLSTLIPVLGGKGFHSLGYAPSHPSAKFILNLLSPSNANTCYFLWLFFVLSLLSFWTASRKLSSSIFFFYVINVDITQTDYATSLGNKAPELIATKIAFNKLFC